MKGFNFTIETVLVLLIAVVILGVIVLFVQGVGGRGIDEISLERNRANLCSQYSRIDSECDGKASPDEEKELKKIWSTNENNLADVCSKLSFPYCSGNTANPSENKKCIQSCCTHACPQTALG